MFLTDEEKEHLSQSAQSLRRIKIGFIVFAKRKNKTNILLGVLCDL